VAIFCGAERATPLFVLVAFVVTALALPEATAAASAVPDVAGKKYSDAATTLTDAGFQPVVSTTVGDRKAWPDCLVTFAQKRDVSAPPNSTGKVTHKVLVSLNCDAAVASAKSPGYSAASQEARAQAAAQSNN
jgi:hypothetical protein